MRYIKDGVEYNSISNIKSKDIEIQGNVPLDKRRVRNAFIIEEGQEVPEEATNGDLIFYYSE